MAHRPPAIVIIARHGPRLDAADQSWHLSTPTPYDPPLTYGGWGQSQQLGVRIAGILNAREKAANEHIHEEEHGIGIKAHDLSDGFRRSRDSGTYLGVPSQQKRKLKHKVVIHTSPFLRCVQTSVAIAAGMAQYVPSGEPGHSRPRTPMSLHSASPKLKAQDHVLTSSYLAPITEPGQDDSAILDPPAAPSMVKLRVDAFLGEWLNPQYFENITPPPPSPMMIATAKAELLSKDQIDVYTPTISSKSSMSTLWGGSNAGNITNGTLDDMSTLQQALPSLANSRRDRASSASSYASTDSDGSQLARRPIHVTRPSLTSFLNQPETPAYQPPRPHYAVSPSENIPRGYVAHARRACINVDNTWDSSRTPLSWSDGGLYGEEWSSMHKRFRKGLGNLVEWYTKNDSDQLVDTAEALDQREGPEEEEHEDLVVILVTHGAGCNALIGALTGQPVLLDIGMASMTMAVRREDNTADKFGTNGTHAEPSGFARRPSGDLLGLSGMYDMRIVSSTEHLRSNSSRPNPSLQARSNLPAFVENDWNRQPPLRRGTSTAVGSIRRPLANNAYALQSSAPGRSGSVPAGERSVSFEDQSRTPTPVSVGLWTPPASRTPTLEAQDRKPSPPHDRLESASRVVRMASPAERRPSPSYTHAIIDEDEVLPSPPMQQPHRAMALALDGRLSGTTPPALVASPIEDESAKRQALGNIPVHSEELPQSLRRGLSQKGLWGARPAGDIVQRQFGQESKRRWTMTRNAA